MGGAKVRIHLVPHETFCLPTIIMDRGLWPPQDSCWGGYTAFLHSQCKKQTKSGVLLLCINIPLLLLFLIVSQRLLLLLTHAKADPNKQGAPLFKCDESLPVCIWFVDSSVQRCMYPNVVTCSRFWQKKKSPKSWGNCLMPLLFIVLIGETKNNEFYLIQLETLANTTSWSPCPVSYEPTFYCLSDTLNSLTSKQPLVTSGCCNNLDRVK